MIRNALESLSYFNGCFELQGPGKFKICTDISGSDSDAYLISECFRNNNEGRGFMDPPMGLFNAAESLASSSSLVSHLMGMGDREQVGSLTQFFQFFFEVQNS